MRWLFLAWAVVLLLVLMLTPAECHARGLFSFFNPEVTVPVTAAPSNGSDIIGGMKATVTLGSLGSVITSHLALIIFGILLYCAICRLGDGYHARVIGLRERKSTERIERRRLWNADKTNRREWSISFFHPRLLSEKMGHESYQAPPGVKIELETSGVRSILEEMRETAARMEAAQRMAAEKAPRKDDRKR